MNTDFDNTSCTEILDYFKYQRSPPDLTSFGTSQTIFITVHAFIFFFGVVGNSLVIAAVAKNRALQTVRNFFIVSLSTSDFAVCIFSLPTTSYTLQFKSWIFGTFMCYGIAMLQGMSVIISTFTLTFIAIDRYILIVHPRIQPITKRAAIIIIVVVWGLAACVSMPSVANYMIVTGDHYGTNWCGRFCVEEGWQTRTLRRIYGTSVLVVQFALPLSIVTYCYIRIITTLSQGLIVRQARQAGSNATDRQLAALRRTQRTNKMLLVMVAVFACAWLPNIMLNILADCDAMPKFVELQNYLYYLTGHTIAMTSTIWNPIVYGFMNDSFKAAFLKLAPFALLSKRGRRYDACSAALLQTSTVNAAGFKTEDFRITHIEGSVINDIRTSVVL